MAHIWTVIPEKSSDRARVYKCARCEAGPVNVINPPGLRASMKSAVREAASKAGWPPDCASEIVRKVMDS